MFRVPVKKSYRLTGLLVIPALLILFVVSAFAAPSNPVDLGITTQYTQFIFDDVNLTDGSATAAVAYGGNAVLTDNNIGLLDANCDPNATAIVVGGDLTLNDTGVNDGKGFVGGTATSNGTSYLECGALDTTTMPVDFAAAEAATIAESARIATGITSGKIKIFDGCSATVEGTSDDFNIFTIDGSILENPNQLAGCSFNVQAECGSINVINVSGTTINTKNLTIGTFDGVEPGQILFNFYEATSLSFMGGGLAGTILAPNADVTVMAGSGGGDVAITGGLIAKSLNGTIASIPAPFGSQPNACSPTAVYDFGDLPANYPTTLVQNGARHEIVAGAPLLGTLVDAEPNGIPSSTAQGDDVDGSNDHDGITTNADSWIGGNNVDSFGVIATANGCLDGWIERRW